MGISKGLALPMTSFESFFEVKILLINFRWTGYKRTKIFSSFVTAVKSITFAAIFRLWTNSFGRIQGFLKWITLNLKKSIKF